ncbi:DUF2225 domain-containing protein [Brevibacillus sp. H7]|uniref:DUF2225 domain-containing protein n=1 Tax=Brevibacillus sp. H7 TaxID=3349138 RepID=UPI00382833E0
MMERLSALYDKTCTCRHCHHSFTTKRVRGGSQAIIQRDADFCTYYKEQSLNPILYTVNVCPACGFAFTDQFTQQLLPPVKRLVQEQISSKWTPKEFGYVRSISEAVVCYKLAIYAAELTGEAHSVKAGLSLRLAWLFRFQNDKQQEKRFLHMAVHEYEQSYVFSDYDKGDKEMSEVRILYLIGELMRRVERYDEAVNYFSKALELGRQSIETGILSMARDQWSLAREEYKQKNQEKIG